MADQIISRDTIKRQARRAAEADVKAGRMTPDCPYELGSPYAKSWYAEYLMTECELQQPAQVVSTFSHGPVEHLEAVQA